MPEEKPPETPKPGEPPAAGAPEQAKPPLPQAQPIEQAAATGKAQPASEEKVAAQTKPVPEAKPAAAPAAKPAAEAAHGKPAAAAPTGPVGEPWTGDIVEALRRNFPDLAIQGFTYLKQNYLIVPRENIVPVMMSLRSEQHFTLLADLTAAHYPQRETQFEVVYQLYSFSRNERLRVKAPLGDGESIDSVIGVWSGADWMEREVFDMFGIRFDHHPNMKRILLPDEWEGYPLRKDYGILQQDVRWVQENLHIESGQ